MKLRSLFLLALLLPVAAWCQTITMPQVGETETPTTTITQVEVTKAATVVTFKHILAGKGAWVQLNKSMYLQNANGEERYNYIKSEGIPLRPTKLYAERSNQEVIFKVYFEKLKPGTKAINIIERARSPIEIQNGTSYFNYFNVSLTKPAPTNGEFIKRTEVILRAPEPSERMVKDTAFATSPVQEMVSGIGPMMGNVYNSMMDAQLKMYSKPGTTAKLAQVTKNYYDALIKVGFSEDAALKIITSKPLVSVDGKQ